MTPIPRPSLLKAVVFVSMLAAASTARAQSSDDAWGPERQWLSMRAGYAKSTAVGAGHGGAGYGFGYVHMLDQWKVYKWTLFKHFSLGGFVHYDVLGRFGTASEIEVPATVELSRHVQWRTALRPYLGIGAGTFMRKTYRTGGDQKNVEFAGYLALGANTPISERHLIGLDARFVRLEARNDPVDPVFGAGGGEPRRSALSSRSQISPTRAIHWSLKVNYSLVY